jgi:hypothetical protein
MNQPTLTPADTTRLSTQAQRIFLLMGDHGHWWTLPILARKAHASEAGASARLRDFRKPEWGSHMVDRRQFNDDTIWWYRLTPNGPLLDGKRNAPTAKMEARERVTAYLDALHPGNHILSYMEGNQLLTADLRELLK